MSEQIESFVESQKDKLRAYLDPKNRVLEFPKSRYFSQRNNSVQPHRTCNTSSNGMYADYLLQATKGRRLGGFEEEEYLKIVRSIGDTTEHWVQTAALKQVGFSTKWKETKPIDQRRELGYVNGLLEAGIPVVVNILHRGSKARPTGGHVIMLVGLKEFDYLAQDPYGTLDSNYTDTDGRLDGIDREEFLQRWQGGYRILA